jgi:hypothetical protein
MFLHSVPYFFLINFLNTEFATNWKRVGNGSPHTDILKNFTPVEKDVKFSVHEILATSFLSELAEIEIT